MKKTKQERQADNNAFIESAKKNRDTPLSKSPDAVAPVTDLKSAFADIEARSSARQKSIAESNAKLNAARAERNKEKTNQTGEGKLQGLASLKNTLGLQ